MIKISYSGYRVPPEIIQHAIWLYIRFALSFRDVEDLLAERGIMVSYETVRRWVNHFGPMVAADLRKRRPKPERTREGFGKTALGRLGRSKCGSLGAASARGGRTDEDTDEVMCPVARRFIAGMTLRAAAKPPNVLVRHAVSKSSRVTSSTEPQTPLPAL
jgi:hypothetical protein